MDFEAQKLLTVVSDVRFALTKLDERYHQPLIDLLIKVNETLQNSQGDINPILSESIEQINKCIADNNLTVPKQVDDVVESFAAFLPTK